MPSEMVVPLYRPVGQAELDLIRASGFRESPPRLPEQPLFYPALSVDYVRQIARDWNANDARSGFVGYVLRFAVKAELRANYDIRTVGSSEHRECWIPAADLRRLNENVVGRLEVISDFRRSVGRSQ